MLDRDISTTYYTVNTTYWTECTVHREQLWKKHNNPGLSHIWHVTDPRHKSRFLSVAQHSAPIPTTSGPYQQVSKENWNSIFRCFNQIKVDLGEEDVWLSLPLTRKKGVGTQMWPWGGSGVWLTRKRKCAWRFLLGLVEKGIQQRLRGRWSPQVLHSQTQ